MTSGECYTDQLSLFAICCLPLTLQKKKKSGLFWVENSPTWIVLRLFGMWPNQSVAFLEGKTRWLLEGLRSNWSKKHVYCPVKNVIKRMIFVLIGVWVNRGFRVSRRFRECFYVCTTFALDCWNFYCCCCLDHFEFWGRGWSRYTRRASHRVNPLQ